jgi:hypothetical protein
LDVAECDDLKYLCCSSNLIEKLDLSRNLQLELLDVADNNLLNNNLSFLSHLRELNTLVLGNSNVRDKRKIKGNRFVASLQDLSNMKKLKWCSVNDLRVTGKLPKDVRIFNVASNIRPEMESDHAAITVSNIAEVFFNSGEGDKGAYTLWWGTRNVLILSELVKEWKEVYDSLKNEVRRKAKTLNEEISYLKQKLALIEQDNKNKEKHLKDIKATFEQLKEVVIELGSLEAKFDKEKQNLENKLTSQEKDLQATKSELYLANEELEIRQKVQMGSSLDEVLAELEAKVVELKLELDELKLNKELQAKFEVPLKN